MIDVIAIALSVATLVGAPFVIVWFSQAGPIDRAPFTYAKTALLGYLCCVSVLWGAMALAPAGGAPAFFGWGLSGSLRWLASVTLSCALSMLAPVLVAYGALKRLTRQKALLAAAALGSLNLGLFAFFFGGLSCLVFFAC